MLDENKPTRSRSGDGRCFCRTTKNGPIAARSCTFHFSPNGAVLRADKVAGSLPRRKSPTETKKIIAMGTIYPLALGVNAAEKKMCIPGDRQTMRRGASQVIARTCVIIKTPKAKGRPAASPLSGGTWPRAPRRKAPGFRRSWGSAELPWRARAVAALRKRDTCRVVFGGSMYGDDERWVGAAAHMQLRNRSGQQVH